MPGTVLGGAKAAQTMKQLYGQDYYNKIGYAGGTHPYKGKKGFAADLERARVAGARGGKMRLGRKYPRTPVVPSVPGRKWWDIKTLIRRYHER